MLQLLSSIDLTHDCARQGETNRTRKQTHLACVHLKSPYSRRPPNCVSLNKIKKSHSLTLWLIWWAPRQQSGRLRNGFWQTDRFEVCRAVPMPTHVHKHAHTVLGGLRINPPTPTHNADKMTINIQQPWAAFRRSVNQPGSPTSPRVHE